MAYLLQRENRADELPSARGAQRIPFLNSLTTLLNPSKVPAHDLQSSHLPYSDAEMYRHAVDYTEMENILRLPIYGQSSSLSPGSQTSLPSATTGCFRRIAGDERSGIELFSTPVENCPIHLMRAIVVLPCSPAELIQYTSNTIRPKWDTFIRESRLVRTLQPPPTAGDDEPSVLSNSLAVQSRPDRVSETSLSATSRPSGHSGPWGTSNSTPEGSTPDPSPQVCLRPGERRVGVHYLGVRSPVPFVQDRDFEVVVSEAVQKDGTAYVKAYSPPLGLAVPLDPHQSRYVRGVILLSGFIARPLDITSLTNTQLQQLPPILRDGIHTGKGMVRNCCLVDYFGLIHPMGMLPPMMVNMVISAQVKSLVKLQQYIIKYPLAVLFPNHAPHMPSPDEEIEQPANAAVKDSKRRRSIHKVALQATIGDDAESAVRKGINRTSHAPARSVAVGVKTACSSPTTEQVTEITPPVEQQPPAGENGSQSAKSSTDTTLASRDVRSFRMLTTFTWVPKGAMKPTPIFSTDTLQQARAKLRRQNLQFLEEEGGQATLDEAQQRDGGETDMDNEDDDVNDTLRDIAGGGSGAILEQVESEDEDEIEDITFKDSDLVFVVTSADSQAPSYELYTYDEPEDNLFLHHDTQVSAFPLSSCWLTDGAMSMLAVGTMLPFVEVWALDVMDSVEPAIILGGCEKAEHNYSKKTLKKNLLPASHTDAVLSVRWNTVAQHILASGSADQSIKLWDLNAGGACVGTYREAGKVQSLDWHGEEGNLLLSGGFDGTMILRDCRNPQQAALRFPVNDAIEHVEFTNTAVTNVMVSTSNGSWLSFETRMNAQPLWKLQPHEADTTFNCSRHVAGLYATGGKEGNITLWDGRDSSQPPKVIVSRAYRTGSVLSLAFHPNSAHILGACGSRGEPLVYTMTADVQKVFHA